jgi:hypothetical protein
MIFFAGTIKSLTIPGFEKGKDQSVKWVQYWYEQIIHGYLKYIQKNRGIRK